MTNFFENLIVYFTYVVAWGLGLFALYTVFIWGPVYLYAEAECLKHGYPKHEVSVNLERYCLNLDGSVTVNVRKAEDMGR